MKHDRGTCRKPQQVQQSARAAAASGPSGCSVRPPSYGIEFVDSVLSEQTPLAAPATAVQARSTVSSEASAAPSYYNYRGDGNDFDVEGFDDELLESGRLQNERTGGAKLTRGQTVQRKAFADGISLGKTTAFNDGSQFGIITPIIVRGTELSKVQDSELVSATIDHTGSFKKVKSITGNTSGWMAADKIPPDRHLGPTKFNLSVFDKHGGEGSLSFLQMDLIKIPSEGINNATPMANSGYRITHHLKANGKTGVDATTTKKAEAATIGKNSTTKGLTAKVKKTNTIRT